MGTKIVENTINATNEISTLLVRSPSCSCVLEDVLQLMMKSWSLQCAAILIANDTNAIKVLARSHKQEEFEEYQEYINSELTEDHSWEETKIMNNKHMLITVPLWLRNKGKGCICLMANKNLVVSSDELLLFKIVSNQISQALERELEKEKTRYYQTLFKSVLGGLTEGIILTNNCDVIFSNKVALNLMHYKGKTVDRVEQLFHAILEMSADPIRTQVYLEAAENNKGTYFFEIETRNRKFLRFTKFPISKESGRDGNWGYLINDITKRRESDKIKDDLLATVSHELKTPLTSIKGNVSTLLRDDVHWSEDEKTEFLMDIYEESERLNDLIEKLLDISKINAGALSLDKTHITVHRLIEKLEQKLLNRYGFSSNIQKLEYRIWNGFDTLYIDEQRIVQVLLNLIDNAIKYGPEDVIIEIVVQRIDDMIQFTVKDNGPGVAVEEYSKIFSKYYRINSDSVTMGSGLGLAICKGFIDVHQGKIWVESIKGEGSAFHFTIPK